MVCGSRTVVPVNPTVGCYFQQCIRCAETVIPRKRERCLEAADAPGGGVCGDHGQSGNCPREIQVG